MFFYFNGCSHTAGAGLFDHSLPGYPGDIDRSWDAKKIETHKNAWMASRQEQFNNDYNLRDKIEQEQKKFAWPEILSNLAGADYINNAVQGSSMESIVMRSILDLNALLETGKKPDRVFIGLTSTPRISLPNPQFNKNKNNTWRHSYVNFHLNFKHSNVPKIYQGFYNSIWSAMTDDNLLIKYFQSIIMMNSFCYEKLNYYPIYVDCGYTMSTDILKNTNSELLLEFKNISMIDTMLDPTFTILRHKKWHFMDRVADGHFLIKYHKELSNIIYNKLFNN